MRQASPNAQLAFRRHDGGRFQIGSVALATMHQFIQDDLEKPEAGGVLLGRYVLDSDDVIVDRVTVPMVDDRQERHRFFRARRRHQKMIDIAWSKSNGTCTYLGEWHTHPQPIPTPSLIDRLDWHRKLVFDQFSGVVFFAIVGTDSMCVWEGRHRRIQLHQLRSIASDVTNHAL